MVGLKMSKANGLYTSERKSDSEAISQ